MLPMFKQPQPFEMNCIAISFAVDAGENDQAADSFPPAHAIQVVPLLLG